MDAQDTDRELLQLAIGGDTTALTVLLAQLDAQLTAQIARKIPADLRSTVDASDIVQETHIRVFQKIQDFDPLVSEPFERWVTTIANRRLLKEIARRRAKKRGGRSERFEESMTKLLRELQGPNRTPSSSAGRHEALDALDEALKQLPEHYRQAVRLVVLEGNTVAEAAAVMERTERAIHHLCYKAKKQLHDLLGSGSRFLSRRG